MFCQIDRGEDRREGGGTYSGQGQSEEPRGISHGFHEPVPLVREGVIQKAQGASNGVRSTCSSNAAGIENEVERETHLPRHALRQGKKNGQWKEPETEVVYLIARFPDGEASPEALLSANRGHWGIEIMHRTKTSSSARTATQIEATTRRETSFPYWLRAQNFEIRLALSTRAIEQFQDDRNKACVVRG